MSYPLSGLRVLELGSRVTAPYVGKLFVDAGAEVVKVESVAGDGFRRWSASGAAIADGDDAAWFRFLNAGKQSVVLDLEKDRGALAGLLADAHLVLDDHAPADARRLAVTPADLRKDHPALVVATLTRFGTTGPWADRAANDFTMQALVGATENRGIPGEEPMSCGGDLGDFVAASLSAPAILAATLAAVSSGRGAHVDVSQYEAMMLAFQTYRPIFDTFAPDFRPTRQIEVPSVEPASDGLVGFCTITGQQWQDFCAMIGAPDMAEDPGLANFHGRMDRRNEVWGRIRAFTETRTVDELVELANEFRIPVGPIGTGDKVAGLDHFVERGVFVENPHGFLQPRPPYAFSESRLAPLRPAPRLGSGVGFTTADGPAPPSFGSDPVRPLQGVKVVDLSAFWAGPVAMNLLRVLGADLVKVEGHVRLDGMRWSSGLPIPLEDQLWEWSPVYHGANAGKRVLNLDLGTERGRELAMELIADADVVIENFSPRVTEGWGITWEAIHARNPRTIFIRVPAYGTEGPWRDRVGFAMTMEQVSGLANRTGRPDGPPMVPRGPVDTIAGMHAVFAAVMALVERDRLGEGQLVELPLIEGALQAAAEQVVEYSAYGNVLTRTGNQSPAARFQGVFRSQGHDEWVAISCETDDQLAALTGIVGAAADDELADLVEAWTAARSAELASATCWRAGVPSAPCVHFNDSGASPQHDHRRFLQWFRHPVTGWTPYPGYPWTIDGAHQSLGGPAPVLGEHNHSVLAGLGLDEAAIAALEADGVTGDWPAMVPRLSG